MAGNVLTGARATVMVNGKPIGSFSSCSWSIRQDKQPAFILGRFNPAEIIPVSQEAVNINLTGFRVVNKGPYAIGLKQDGQAFVTKLSELLQESYSTITITDRKTGKKIFDAKELSVNGWSSGVTARGVSDIRLDIIGIAAGDETNDVNSDEDPGAPNIEDGG